MGRNKALILAAVVMALAAATTAQAYYETWNGWFHEGTLYYNGNAYTRDYEGGQVRDSTYSASRDTFYTYSGLGHFLFVYSAGSDSIILYVGNICGGKQTGQSGTKEGSGTWSGSAIRRKNTVETTWNSVSGTWNTDGDDYGFFYGSPSSYHAEWLVKPPVPCRLLRAEAQAQADLKSRTLECEDARRALPSWH